MIVVVERHTCQSSAVISTSLLFIDNLNTRTLGIINDCIRTSSNLIRMGYWNFALVHYPFLDDHMVFLLCSYLQLSPFSHMCHLFPYHRHYYHYHQPLLSTFIRQVCLSLSRGRGRDFSNSAWPCSFSECCTS